MWHTALDMLHFTVEYNSILLTIWRKPAIFVRMEGEINRIQSESSIFKSFGIFSAPCLTAQVMTSKRCGKLQLVDEIKRSFLERQLRKMFA